MKPILLFLLSLFFLITTSAQPKKSPWKFSSTNSLAYYSGNIKKLDVLTNNEIEKKDSAQEFSLSYLFLYGEQDDTKYLLEHLASAYYDYRPYQRLSPWMNATFLHNIYKGFDARLNAGTGLKYRFIYNDEQDWSLSAGVLLDYTDYSPPTESKVTPRTNETIWRLSIRPKIKIKLTENISIKHVTFYQPQITDFGNFIAWSQTEFSVKVYRHINLSLLYYYFYNSRPAYETISKVDQRVMVGVKVEL